MSSHAAPESPGKLRYSENYEYLPSAILNKPDRSKVFNSASF